MAAGVAAYFVYTSLPWLDGTHRAAHAALAVVQPVLIFAMLFLTFCKIRPQDLRLARWHAWGLLLQVGLYTLLSVALWLLPAGHWRVVVEGGMLCLICPTATAAAVVTSRLGGDARTLTTYTILINICVSICVPALVPLVHPHASLPFWGSFLTILSRVFPLLFLPFVAATALRWVWPAAVAWLTRFRDLAFYLWAVSLMLAITVTTRSIVHAACPIIYMAGIALASAAACALQFAVGRRLGRRAGDTIAAAQSLGQKNTVFAIWMGYTFMDPVTSLAGGFYSLWHNIYNSWQLAHTRE